MNWGEEMEEEKKDQGMCLSHFSHTNDLKIEPLWTPGEPKGLSQRICASF